MKKKFVIIDAMSLAYKGYYAFINRPLSTSAGEPTSAVFGFVSQLLKILEDTRPDYIAVAFDSKEKTFRHERYNEYKSSRAEMPDDMIPQIKRIQEIIEAMKIPIYILPGYEADDLIGTALKKAETENLDSYAITPDKDYIQLINENTKIIKPGRSAEEIVIVDIEKVKEDYQFEPERMIDYLALVGDQSDDIPGVKGIGPVTAKPLIQKFGSIENIYDNLEKIEKKSIREKLELNKDNAFLSKELATIKLDVPFDINFADAKFEKPDIKKLTEIFDQLEIKSFTAKLLKIFAESGESRDLEEDHKASEIKQFDPARVEYTLIREEKKARELAKILEGLEEFVFDTETDSLNVFDVNLAGVSFSFQPYKAYFVAVNPKFEKEGLFSANLSDRLPIDRFKEIFKIPFENPKIRKICQNGKYDISVLRSLGIGVNNFFFDTMLASYVIDPDEKHGMDSLAKKYLDYTPIPLIEIIGSKKTPEKIFEIGIEKLSDYSCEDSDITMRLYHIFKEIIDTEKLNRVAYDIEFPLVPVLEDMERTGIRIDESSLKDLSVELQKSMNDYTKDIFKYSGIEFNINSPQQLQHILFEKLNLQPTKKTKTGFSTDARSLEALKGQHEIIDKLLDYRQAAKLKSTYADALPRLVNPQTGRIHTTFNQTVASTGRLSSNDPNLQNIPIRTELGKEIRKAFIGSDDHYILSADYSQIELRIMASICGDEGLKKAFLNREDIHRTTAAQVFKVAPDEVTQDMRRKAKEVNFGILYGIGVFGLKNRLGITQSHAKEIIETYFSTFKRVKDFMDNAVNNARERGYAETLTGRRRYLRNINSNNRVIKQFEERVAINMPIQGTAADMIKLAMIKIHDALIKNKFKSKMVLQVHDELLFDVPKDELEDVNKMIIELMVNALPLDVPVAVESGYGTNWLDAH